MSSVRETPDNPLEPSHRSGPATAGFGQGETLESGIAEQLLAAAHAMHSTLKLTELYDLVLSTVLRLLDSECAVLLLQRPRTHHPIVFKLRTNPTGSVSDLPAPLGRSFLDWVGEHHADDAAFRDAPVDVIDRISETAELSADHWRWIRLATRGNLLGVLGVLSHAQDADLRNTAILDSLVEQATVALDNALLYRLAERRSLENELLLESSRLLMSSLDLDEVLDAIMDSLQRAVPYNAAGIFLVGPDGPVERIVDRGYDPSKRSTLDLKAGVGLVGWVAERGEPLVIDDVREDSRYQNARESTRSEMVVPIFSGDRLVGVFNLERDIVDGFFEADLDLVHAFAQHAGVAIERARNHAAEMEQRRIKGELEAARQIQTNFLPRESPRLAEYDIAGINISSEEVGGDYYDYIPIVEGQTGIAIADSSGKGIPAALIMAAFRASLIAEIRNNYALHQIMQKVNRLLCDGNEETRFVTAIYGVLDSRSHVFTFSNAGHNPGILRRVDGTIVLLNALGMALGIFPDAVYEERVIGLSPGDTLLFYTDGVTDVIGDDGEMFEIDRLIDVLQRHPDASSEQILTAVRDAVNEFADPNAPVDDFTMVVIRVR